jgi:hypothetical protein
MTERIADLAWWLIVAIRQATEPTTEPHDPPAVLDPIVVVEGGRRYTLSIAHEGR